MIAHAYAEARAEYWRVQTQFRYAAVEEFRRHLPADAHRALLEVNDTPRLTVVDLLDADGESVLNDLDPAYHALDSIAMDMEVWEYEEGKSFLSRTDSGQFYIDREPVEATLEATKHASPTTDNPATSPRPTEAQTALQPLVHEARNVLWSHDNGGYAGRASELQRVLTSICDEAERLWGAP